jgi:hypothetical protein
VVAQLTLDGRSRRARLEQPTGADHRAHGCCWICSPPTITPARAALEQLAA